MGKVISKDGTSIGYTKIGHGPAVILVDGALCCRSSGPNGSLAAQLSSHFTVYTYDRRGRGESNEVRPYAIEREVEDLSAVIEEAGGSVYVYGISSGAALALESAKRLSSIKKLFLYEAPFVVDHSRPSIPDNYISQLDGLLSANKQGAAVKHFMRKGVNLPAFIVAMMPFLPAWSKLKAMAHTLPYDTILTADFQQGRSLPSDYWSNVNIPTLVGYGSKSPVWMQNGMKALVHALPQATIKELIGQTHLVKPQSLAPLIIEFYQQ